MHGPWFHSWPVPATREGCKYFIYQRARNSARARGNRKNPIYGSLLGSIHSTYCLKENFAAGV
ncbi:hypothetical protein PAHAL_9G008300 [Panicum hallii]|uniref:Uncharacterized protein n=1 Tax=Panicum hallii TaxID=206008 RepID=A0A2T8HZX6_9POAL|nr:hypothetical protein PAHAL_9G008300 [Panicum hallii]